MTITLYNPTTGAQTPLEGVCALKYARSALLLVWALALPYSAFGRVGETLTQLKERYGEPVKESINGTLKSVVFKTGNFQIVSSFKAGGDKVFAEAVFLPNDVRPEVVVQKIAGKSQIALFPGETTNSLMRSGVVPSSTVAMWVINSGPQIFAAYLLDSSNGGAVYFASDVLGIQPYIQSLASSETDGL